MTYAAVLARNGGASNPAPLQFGNIRQVVAGEAFTKGMKGRNRGGFFLGGRGICGSSVDSGGNSGRVMGGWAVQRSERRNVRRAGVGCDWLLDTLGPWTERRVGRSDRGLGMVAGFGRRLLIGRRGAAASAGPTRGREWLRDSGGRFSSGGAAAGTAALPGIRGREGLPGKGLVAGMDGLPVSGGGFRSGGVARRRAPALRWGAGVVAGFRGAFLLRWPGGWDSRPPGDSWSGGDWRACPARNLFLFSFADSPWHTPLNTH